MPQPAILANPLLDQLPLMRLVVNIQLTSAVRMPPLMGDAWHGGLGKALYDTSREAYAALFDRRDEAGQATVRPMVVQPPQIWGVDLPAGEPLSFGLLLLGPALGWLPELGAALLAWAKRGLWHQHGQFRIIEISQRQPDGSQQLLYLSGVGELAFPQPTLLRQWLQRPLQLPATRGVVSIGAISPIHLQYQNHSLRQAPAADVLLRAIGRRLSLVGQLMAPPADWLRAISIDQPLDCAELLADHSYVVGADRAGRIHRSGHPLSGLLGHWVYRADLDQIWPWLSLAELLHLGNKSAFGFGQIRWSWAAQMSDSACG